MHKISEYVKWLNSKFFKNNWVKFLILPVLASVISYFIFVFFIEGLNKSKTGEVQIFCNVDSTKVYLDGEFKGITGPSNKNQNMFVLKITSLDPGTYPLMLKKKSYPDAVVPDLKVDPGYITSKMVILTPLANINENDKLEIDDIDNEKQQPETKDEISPVKENNNASTNTKKEEELEPEILENKIKNIITVQITEEIQISKVKLYVNSEYMPQISKNKFPLELSEGEYKIMLIYDGPLGEHTWSINKIISGNETLYVEKNDFKPKI